MELHHQISQLRLMGQVELHHQQLGLLKMVVGQVHQTGILKRAGQVPQLGPQKVEQGHQPGHLNLVVQGHY